MRCSRFPDGTRSRDAITTHESTRGTTVQANETEERIPEYRTGVLQT
jgi:hypothetical protein